MCPRDNALFCFAVRLHGIWVALLAKAQQIVCPRDNALFCLAVRLHGIWVVLLAKKHQNGLFRVPWGVHLEGVQPDGHSVTPGWFPKTCPITKRRKCSLLCHDDASVTSVAVGANSPAWGPSWISKDLKWAPGRPHYVET